MGPAVSPRHPAEPTTPPSLSEVSPDILPDGGFDARKDQRSQTNTHVAEPKATDQDDHVEGLKLFGIVTCVALACFLMLIDTMVVSTVIPRITDEFKSLPDVGWYASAYQFGSAAPQPLSGKIYTHFKSKWAFLFFFGIFELGSLLCGAAVSSPMLIVGRAVAGLGGAGIVNGAITIVSGCVPLEKRPALIGLIAGINQLGLVVGPLVGGAFTSYSTWRWAFYINLPVGAITAVGVLCLRIPELALKQKAVTVLPKIHHHLDLLGFSLFAPSVLMLLLALMWGGNDYAWSSPRVIGLFCGALATFLVWILWNRYLGEDALIPPSMVAKTAVWVSALFQAMLMAAVFGVVYYLPIYFQAVKNVDALLSGVYLLPMIIPQLVFAAAAGIFFMRVGYVIPFAVFGTALLSAGCGLFSTLQPNSSTGKWVGFQIISGIGSGSCLQMSMIAIQAAVTAEQLPSAMAFLVFAQSMGPAIVLALCNVIFDASLRTELEKQLSKVDAEAIISAGATAFRSILAPGQLDGVLKAYSESLDHTFYLIAGSAASCIIILWGMGWKNLKKKDEKTDQEKELGRKEGSEQGD